MIALVLILSAILLALQAGLLDRGERNELPGGGALWVSLKDDGGGPDAKMPANQADRLAGRRGAKERPVSAPSRVELCDGPRNG